MVSNTSATDKKLTFRSLLCDTEIQAWLWDELGATSISFDKGGTGRIRCGPGAEMMIAFAAEFRWRSLEPESFDGLIVDQGHEGRPYCLGKFDIELTLSKQRLSESPPRPYDTLADKPGEVLTDAAFLPKRHTIYVEKGSFLVPEAAQGPPWWSSVPTTYAYRLVFDKSPFPSRDEWKEDLLLMADRCKFWDITTFVDCTLPKDEGWLNRTSYWVSWLAQNAAYKAKSAIQ